MNIYAGNLAYSITDQSLRDAFEEFGTVDSAKVIQDRDTGRSKGFGFVEMSNDDDAKAAIEALNEKELDGRNLNINEARPKPEGGDRGGFSGGGGRRY
jgi:cold-inducible RNA-binding protein